MVVGIDIGGSATKTCLTKGDVVITSTTLPTTLAAPTDLGDLALGAVNDVAEKAGVTIESLSGIGVGTPGQVWGGTVTNAANLGVGDDGYDLGRYLSTATGLPVLVENDMTMAAFGAFTQMTAAEPDIENLVYIGLGTGISAGLVLGGRVFRGSRGLAGEFGHVPMGTGNRCACGSVGCLETVTGAAGLGDSWEGNVATSLFTSAANGDQHAVGIVDRAMDYLARAMWWLAAAYDPDCFVIGGGIGIRNPSIKRLLTRKWGDMAADSALARRVLDPERILMSDLEEPVGAYGAALLVTDSKVGSEKPNQRMTGRRQESK